MGPEIDTVHVETVLAGFCLGSGMFVWERMCCSFYQYLPIIKSGPTGYHNLTTSLVYKFHLMKLHHLSPFFLYNPIKSATHSLYLTHLDFLDTALAIVPISATYLIIILVNRDR